MFSKVINECIDYHKSGFCDAMGEEVCVLIAGKRKTLGVFMNKADPNFQTAVQNISRQFAREMDYDVFYFYTVGYRDSANFYDEQEKSMFTFAPMEKLDGALVAPDTYDMHGFRESLFNMLEQRAKCPIVCIRDSLSRYDSFYTDETVSIRPLLRHLLEDHGFRKICFLAGYEEHPDSNNRLACYLDEMEEHGAALPVNAIYHGSMWSRGIEEAYAYFFGNPDTWPEAVVCANDYMAHALIEQLHIHGYNVPQDTVVTGFDDIESSEHSVPTMTTICQDYTVMVTKAMERLHQRIQAQEQGLEPAPYQHQGIPAMLKIRESCGCTSCMREERLAATAHRLELAHRKMNVREVSQTYFAIELHSADSYEEMHDTIFRKLGDFPAMRDFYLCMFRDENGFAGHITPQAQLVSAIQDRQDLGMPMICFDREELLPSIAERSDEPQAFYVHLLHQRRNTYGYTVIQFKDQEGPSQFYLNWNIIVSIALRNLDYQGKLKALYEERHRSSVTDVLTGLYNRRGVNEHLDPIWEQLCQEKRTICFASIDMDNLKPINDTFGHQGGDEALCVIADGIRASLPEGAIAARIGGDEYLVFIPDCDEDDAAAFTGRFESYLTLHNLTARFPVGASIGTKVFRLAEGIGLDRCVNESDECMYRVKRNRHEALEKHARFFGKTRRDSI